MPRELDPSIIEDDFLHSALKEGVRLDGRSLADIRDLRLSFGEEFGWTECRLGQTRFFSFLNSLVIFFFRVTHCYLVRNRVAAQVSAEITKPNADRPYEGFLLVSAEVSPMASSVYEAGRCELLQQRFYLSFYSVLNQDCLQIF
jgi:exosome complex component RRP45